MKLFKRLMAVMFALTLTLGMGTRVYAKDDEGTDKPTTYTITMTSTTGHTYTAYQVFAGDLDAEEGTLSNITWGTGVNETDLLNALKSDATYGTAFTNCATAADVAKKLATYTNSADIAALAKIIGAHKATEAGNGTTSISGLAAGYYLIVDTTAENSMPAGNTYSDFMLEVVKNVEVAAKDTTTTSEKKVKDINDSQANSLTNWQDSADYDLGDAVPFKLKGTVASDYDKYSTYYFAFHDEECEGLTFNANSVHVYVDDVEITEGFVVNTTSLEDDCTFEVVFENLKNISSVNAGSVITVEYNSTLNESAVMGSEGNPNTSHIEFSNNPNGDQHGKTPDDTVIVFTYKVVVNKVDENNQPLTGAGFTLYKKNDAGEYVAVGSELKGAAMTEFTWNRLDDGDYKIVETTTPPTYNTITPIEFSITADHEVTSESPQLTNLSGDVTSGQVTFTPRTQDGSLTTTVINQKGSTLPSTGGIGTTIFYVLGGLLVAGAGIVLVARKKAAE